ncbi:LPS export ABC transporter ATP-binding protein [soil metagenome]
MTALLTADCVSKSFGGRRILSSASLRAVPSQLKILLGRNGAGKSTLLKIAAGRIQPDTGSVHWEGEAFMAASLPSLAELGLFYLPDHDLLSNAFSIRAQLTMIRRQFDGLDPELAAERMGVESLLDRKPSSLSGGELRRVELAAVFTRQPRCLLADEPYRGIAPNDAERLTWAFRELASTGVAVVVTGHEVPTLLDAADSVVWSTSGTTYELGTPEAACQNERFRREYLGL